MIATAARLALSLAVVLGLMAMAARYLRQRQGGGRLLRSGGAAVQVVTRHSLTRNASIAVVRVEGALLLLGVTDQSVQVLRELDEADADLSPEPAADPTSPQPPRVMAQLVRHAGGALGVSNRSRHDVAGMVDLLRERTVRRG